MNIDAQDIRKNIEKINDTIINLKNRLGLSYPVTIVGVTKTLPAAAIKEAVSCGITNIGENRVQEAENKFIELEGFTFTKHLIGHLQENKINKAAVLFDVIQSIDSFETAKKLDRKLSEINLTMPILIEVNTSGEDSKFGVKPENTESLIGQITGFNHLRLSGLMTVGPLTEEKNEIRNAFRLLYSLRERIRLFIRGISMDILSMGMSGDFEIAIEEGSNMVRLGRVIFGERNS